ncbi:poly-gamma-glutamate synthesis protein (capsule biosynthesis protein) [Streptomyces sp. 3211.6]|uniref:CapA family protein n=1 Tax=Streptomyces sp. 3211.6 TaxID=1938845 RepID=UPI000EAE38D1|nr:CapA family protein [Streptomyces sp. 3211.6]RKT05341.1 poly-gamma-glutamate synthesis protein (capsule biosynthesis protein) [Streptomyces sp. 3211.6]
MNPRPTRLVSPRALTALLCASLSLALAGCGLLGSATGGGAGGDGGDGVKGGGRSFSVAAAGDILIHPQLTDQAARDARAAGRTGYDFDRIMAGVKPVISKADLGICHMEPVLGEPNGPFQTYPDFLVPPQIAKTVKSIGYDTCSTASNHTLDHGPEGVYRTLDTLDREGLRHTGSARSQQEADKPNILDVKGVKVAQISFASGFNGRQVPQDKPWLANLVSVKAVAAAEKRARAAGAEVVILSVHWGREHQPDPSGPQLELARQIARETGVDLVIGHHAHVVQPMEKIDGTWVAYGLGNQLARHDVPSGLTEEGAIGWFDFTEKSGKWEVRARYVPTYTDIPPDPESAPGTALPGAGTAPVRDHRLVDVAAALASGTTPDGKELLPEQRARYRLAFERTRGTLLNRGAAKDGLRPLRELPD